MESNECSVVEELNAYILVIKKTNLTTNDHTHLYSNRPGSHKGHRNRDDLGCTEWGNE